MAGLVFRSFARAAVLTRRGRPRAALPLLMLAPLIGGSLLGAACTRSAAPGRPELQWSEPAAIDALGPEVAVEEQAPLVYDPTMPADPAAEMARVIPVPSSYSQPYRARLAAPDRLVIPRIGIDARIVPVGVRTDRLGNLVWETAAFAVGHHAGSAVPGEPGNVVLSGHISSPNEGAVFRHLPRIKIDDGVIVFSAQQPHLYRVFDIQVYPPDALQVLDQTSTPIVTLITCVPDGVYSHRLVVRAEAV